MKLIQAAFVLITSMNSDENYRKSKKKMWTNQAITEALSV